MANSNIIMQALLDLIREADGVVVCFAKSGEGLQMDVGVNGTLVDGVTVDWASSDVALEGDLETLRCRVEDYSQA